MTRDDPTTALIALLRRVPVHAIDRDAAHRQGDEAAIAYATAMAKWRAEAALAIADVEQGSTARSRHSSGDAFTRIAEASALMRLDTIEQPSPCR